MKRRKKNRRLLIVLIVIFVTIFGIVSRFFASGTASFTIPKGANAAEISQILKDNGMIKSQTYFLARLYFSPYRKKLQYGTFKLDKNTPVGEIMKKLATEGKKKTTVTVTIPEGYSVEMICDKFCELGITTTSEFESALKSHYDYDFLKCIPKSSDIKYALQGFLYPSTYEFYQTADAKTVIDKMLSEFEKRISTLGISDSDLFEVITKASIIEREAKLNDERPIIAGVFENRIKANMPLQIDATVVYAVTNGRYDINKVTYKHLKTDSKYNTYKYKGLPAGPICCPSIESIKAAQNPQKHEYLYYHTDTEKNNGSHIFTKTFDEHKNTK